MTQLLWLFKWPLLKQNFCKWRDFHAYYFELLQEINFRAQKAIFYNGHKELQNVFYPLSLLHLKAFNPDQPLLDIFLVLLGDSIGYKVALLGSARNLPSSARLGKFQLELITKLVTCAYLCWYLIWYVAFVICSHFPENFLKLDSQWSLH